MFSKGCKLDDMNSCYILAKSQSNKKKISDLCDMGFIKACDDNLVSESVLNEANKIGFLYNKEINQLKVLCQKGETISCVQLTTFTDFFSSSEKDKFVLLRACKDGLLKSCYSLGAKFSSFEKYPKGYFSKDEFVKIINEINPKQIMNDSKQVFQRKYKFKELVVLAENCMIGNRLSCLILGYSEYDSDDIVKFVTHSVYKKLYRILYQKIIKYFKTYCDEKGMLCDQYRGAYWAGYFEKSKKDQYRQLSKELCEKDVAGGCQQYAVHLDSEKFSEEVVHEYYKKACFLGNPGSCKEMALFELKRGNERESKIYNIYGCQERNGKSTSCWDLNKLIEDLTKLSDKFSLLNYGCYERKSEEICDSLNSYYLKSGQLQRVKKNYGELCSKDSELFCRHLAQIYFYEGKINSSKEILRSACYRFDTPNTCFEYGNFEAYEGMGISASITLKKYCENGSQSICEAVKAIKAGKKPINRHQIFQRPLDFGDGNLKSDFSWAETPYNWFSMAQEEKRNGKFKLANSFYEKACYAYGFDEIFEEQTWMIESCATIGNAFKESGNIRGYDYYKRACDINNKEGSFACSELGNYYWDKDVEKASKYLKLACEDENSLDCLNLAHLKWNNHELENSKYYYLKACELGEKKGCDDLKKNFNVEIRRKIK